MNFPFVGKIITGMNDVKPIFSGLDRLAFGITRTNTRLKSIWKPRAFAKESEVDSDEPRGSLLHSIDDPRSRRCYLLFTDVRPVKASCRVPFDA